MRVSLKINSVDLELTSRSLFFGDGRAALWVEDKHELTQEIKDKLDDFTMKALSLMEEIGEALLRTFPK
jgi:hypothetical protein